MDVLSCTAFLGTTIVAEGTLPEVARKVKKIMEREENEEILIFDDSTSELIEVDFRGTWENVLQKLKKNETQATQEPAENTSHGPGRPKLGVISREVSLLPRHWDWLNTQPGGASATLRKLVEEAKRMNRDRDKIRHSQEITYKFLVAMAGDMAGFEEATRALFAGDYDRFENQIAAWPTDIRNYADKLSATAFRR
jgi:uncharacterized protein